MEPRNLSTVAIIGAITAFGFMGLAAILFVQADPQGEGLQRIGLFFAIVSSVVMTLVAMLKADMAANNTNGKLDARIENAVLRANNARRRGDAPMSPDEIDGG